MARKRKSKKKKGQYIGFKKLTRQLKRKGARDPRALAAYIGRKKYGKAEFQRMAARGRTKKGRKRRKG